MNKYTRPLGSVFVGILAATIISLPATATDLQLLDQQIHKGDSLDAVAAESKINYGSNVYIVQLEDPAMALYMGDQPGLPATSNRATGAKKLNPKSESGKKYSKYLRGKQARVLNSMNYPVKVKRDYQVVFNGFAAEFSEDQAQAMRNMSGVKSVARERVERLLTDSGPNWINAPAIWSGPPNNLAYSQGEGIVVAVLDSGINSDHPSFADLGGDGYDHVNPLGSGNYVPGSHCDKVDPSFCNDKLIGAWDFTGPADGNTPEDDDGHGSHTASTAAGNVVNASVRFANGISFAPTASGVARHANIIAYDVCIDTCPGSALLAAIEQVVIDAAALPDGIHALNYSISGGSNPYNDAVELGFLGATAAGVYVSASAGNSGPGPSTNGHSGPWVATTASMTHDREFPKSLANLSSDAAPLPDITGVGITGGFGPARIINSADLEASFPGSTLCGLGSIGDFNPPWPPGTFNGEIVACTRGTFGRIEKGANALSAGAGGYILMDNGGGIVADPHVLPGIHISQTDGAILAAWLAANPNAQGTLTEFQVQANPAAGDITAGSSSRGPATAVDVIKPDMAAPGVSILAAVENGGALLTPEFGFLSGTSMSSPHNAGAGALLSAVQPNWSPYEIRSALMMTAERFTTRKEDTATPTDAFDVGAGRIDLSRAQEAGLVLNETPDNFLAANPATGGDPASLNLASMQNSNCVGTCSWTRRVENVTGHDARWDMDTFAEGELGLSFDHNPKLKIKKNASATITLTADTTLAADGWNFGSLELQRDGDGPDLHMPIAVFAATSTNAALLTKTVDKDSAMENDTLTYNIGLINGQLDGVIDLRDVLPEGLNFISGSESAVVANGTTVSPFAYNQGALTWSGTLDKQSLAVVQGNAPFGFVPLASQDVAPFGCPGNCDDGAFALNVPSFTYNGESYSSVIWSVNGTLEAGTASGRAASATNQQLPGPVAPNNILAPFWTDLDMGSNGDGAEWYIAVFDFGTTSFTAYEWNNIPLFGDPTRRYSFQIWVENGDAGNIWFTYGQLDDVSINASVGAEDATGTIGDSYYYNGNGTAPAVGTDLSVESVIGGTAEFTFQAEVDACNGKTIVNRANVTTATTADTAIAVSRCAE